MSVERIIRVRAIVIHDGKLLCVRLNPYDGDSKLFWCLPGGKVDPVEPLIPALHREMTEETGITPDIGALLYVHQFDVTRRSGQHEETLEFFFHVKNAADYLDVDLSKTTHGELEIAEIDFIDAAHAGLPVRPTFLQTEDFAAHIAANEPAKLFTFLGQK